MRVISGALKGKSINFLKNLKTRPLKDSVKENIFNVLDHSNLIKIKIENSNVLDLYSGVGSFGIECISRGAHRVTFVENDRYASNVLGKNLDNLSIIKKTEIYNCKIENFLSHKFKQQFDIVFLDPPFADFKFINNLKTLKNKNILSKKHIVIIHREKKTEDNLQGLLDIILMKQYGRSKIIYGVLN